MNPSTSYLLTVAPTIHSPDTDPVGGLIALAIIALIIVGPLAVRAAMLAGSLTMRAVGLFLAHLMGELIDRLIDAVIIIILMMFMFDLPLSEAVGQFLRKMLA